MRSNQLDLSDRIATVERIKCMPCLFMVENIGYSGECKRGQKVIFGFIQKLQVTENGVKVRFEPHTENISQKAINAIAEDICISVNKGVMELNTTHWSIKRTDLIDELEEAGLVEV